MPVLIALVLLAVFVIVVLFYLSGEPNTVAIKVNSQANVIDRSGTLVVNISIENVGLDPITVQGVGLDADLLDNVVVQEILIDSQPARLSDDDKSYTIYGSWTQYTLDRELAGGRTIELTFALVPLEAGAHAGDVTVWIEEDMLGMSLARAARERLDFEVR